ncbi:DUF2752 domain-containing protein [Eubacterium xylanophilum]|uniref:DUF2752 domain-containing protein n=1 Tax=Eubacterium xylanophilum TaxID=39497 RepID=UPI00068512CD|nr:DUF2752 domain-containing protein [Eubacterium xylanophilum]MCR5798207.1 DUF2752 domain-containing protein [Eubacterium sp.]
MNNKDSIQTKRYYIFGIGILIFLCLTAVFYKLGYLGFVESFKRPCIVRLTLGIYCPGCGITRSIKSLLSLDFLGCLYHHPFVFYVAALYAIFMVVNTLHYLTAGRRIQIPVFRLKMIYIIIGIIILFGQWILKNMGIYQIIPLHL